MKTQGSSYQASYIYPVHLNIYRFNNWFFRQLGLYYSSIQGNHHLLVKSSSSISFLINCYNIEVHCTEYGFSTNVVFSCEPQKCHGRNKFVHSIKINETTMRSTRQVEEELISILSTEYTTADCFHSFINNSNHFSDRLCLALTSGQRSVLSWTDTRRFNFCT